MANQDQNGYGIGSSHDLRGMQLESDGSHRSEEELATRDDSRDLIIRQRQQAIEELEHELSVLNARLEMQSKLKHESRNGSTLDRREQRARLVKLVLEQANELPLRRACAAVGLSRATLYRRMQSNAG